MANKNIKLKDALTGDYLYPVTLASNTSDISVINISADTASYCNITGSNNAGKSLTIIYANTAAGSVDRIISIPNNVVTPNGISNATIICPADGYCEINYLNVRGIVYARFL